MPSWWLTHLCAVGSVSTRWVEFQHRPHPAASWLCVWATHSGSLSLFSIIPQSVSWSQWEHMGPRAGYSSAWNASAPEVKRPNSSPQSPSGAQRAWGWGAECGGLFRLGSPGSCGEELSLLPNSSLPPLPPETRPLARMAATLWEFFKCAASPGSARVHSLARAPETRLSPPAPWPLGPLCHAQPAHLGVEATPDIPKVTPKQLGLRCMSPAVPQMNI